MNFARYEYFLPFSEKQKKKQRRFSPRLKLALAADAWAMEVLTGDANKVDKGPRVR
jgi:hypothetical protein